MEWKENVKKVDRIFDVYLMIKCKKTNKRYLINTEL